jgi:transposase InsO family protein
MFSKSLLARSLPGAFESTSSKPRSSPLIAGKPVENAYVESFNGKLRNECLNQHWFTDLLDARRLIEEWRIAFNEVRPHSSLDGMTPKEYAAANNGLTSNAA